MKYSYAFQLMTAGILLFGGSTWAQQKGKPSKSSAKADILLTFDNKQTVSKQEFERVYQKNNGGYDVAKTHKPEQYRDYLNLYINFKRKVFEAEAKGLDKERGFQQEFEQYRKQLAQPYLTAKEVDDRLVQEAYDRSKFSINADHILVNVSESALPADTLKAYQQIWGYRDSVLKGGKSFAYMAEKYSQDPSAKSNKGNLGYFNVFEMVYPFESAAYNTPVGQVSMPVRTQFGYHLVKVNERVAYEGKKRVSHIIVRVGDRFSAKDTAQAHRRIDEIYENIQKGGDFAELAKQFSDDPSTASKGGDLGTGRLIAEMENIKMTLGENQVSKPFQTPFGWHIMKVSEVEKLKSFDEAKAGLKQRIGRDSRAQISRDVLIARVKKEAGYTFNEANFKKFAGTLDDKFPQGTWKPDSAAKYGEVFFKIGDTLRTAKQFIAFYEARKPRMANAKPEEAANSLLKAFVDDEVIKFEEARLPQVSADYNFLLKEYHDGILLFSLMEKMVWKKAVEDTAGLHKFYETNKEGFKADATVEVKEYRTTKREIADEVYKMLQAGKSDAEIDTVVNKTSSIALTRRTQFFEKGKTDTDTEVLFDKSVGYISNIKEENKGSLFRIWVITAKRPAGIKPFEMAKSECITKYQDALEKSWLQELEKKYPVKVHEDVFAKLYK